MNRELAHINAQINILLDEAEAVKARGDMRAHYKVIGALSTLFAERSQLEERLERENRTLSTHGA